ncbi:MAG: CpaF family protein [Myxococcales bacterium]|nr:CpaF family protein [Myxococcales bacterium]
MIPQEIFEEALLEFFAPVRPFLDDPAVSEVMINGPNQVFIEKGGKLELTGVSFESTDALIAALRTAAQFAGKFVDETRPILEGRLPDGSRLQAIIPPAGPGGPFIAIRRFFKETLTVDRLVRFGSMGQDAADTLKVLVEAKLNVIIAGGTGSGKTSMLNALSSYIPEGERIVVIEDSKEVQLQKTHVVQLEARAADPKGRGAVTIRDLFRATLRMRPDRVIIGEIRGGEALDIVQAMTSGHGGCMGTCHATYPRDTMTRLETMCMMSDIDMPLPAMRAQLGSGINLIVQVSRLQDGSRKTTHITEVLGYDTDTGKYQMQDIFARQYLGMGHDGTIQSEFKPTGIIPHCEEQLREHGVELPPVIYDAARRRGADPNHREHG